MKTICVAVLLLAACSREVPATPPPPPACISDATRLCPVDEADADFAAFRAQLLDIVKRRDTDALLVHVDPNMRIDFGDGGGIDAFRRTWKLPDANSTLWPQLEFILTHGGSFRERQGRVFRAPYFYSNWPDDVDAFEHVAAVRADVPVFANADPNAVRVAESNYAILQIVPDPDWRPEAPWRQVRTHEGKSGWVRSEDVRSSIDFRAAFSKRSGAWKLESLVAGD